MAEPDILEILRTTRPRETSGADTASRFDYQRNWALCLLLRRQRDNEDLLLVLEHHEDVLVLDSQESPSRCTFYQVKTTRATTPRLTDFLKPRGQKKDLPSDLARLFLSGSILPPENGAMVLVCNLQLADLRGTLRSMGADTPKSLNLLPMKDAARIRECIGRQLARGPGEIDLRRLFFERASLSLDDHEAHTLGVVAQFLSDLFPNRSVRASAVYENLTAELRRRSNIHREWTTVEEYLSYKSVGPKSIKGMLDSLRVGYDWDATWTFARTQLQSEQVAFSRIHRIHKAWNQLEIDLLASDPQHELQSFLTLTHRAAASVDQADRHRLASWLDATLAAMTRQSPDGYTDREPFFVEAAVLLAIMQIIK